MSNKTGTVANLSVRSNTSKTTGRPYSIHSVVLDDGTEIEVGFKQTYNVGDYFNRTVETKFGKLKDVGPAVAGATQSEAPAPRSTGPSAPATGRTFPVGRESPEMSIIRQNALTNARELVVGLGIYGGASVTSTKTERQQYLDTIVEDVLYVAYKFTDFSSGQREVKQAQDMARMNPPSV